MRVRLQVSMAISAKPCVNYALYARFCSSAVAICVNFSLSTTSKGSTVIPNSSSASSSDELQINQCSIVAGTTSSVSSDCFTERLDLLQSIGITPDGFSRIVSAFPQVLSLGSGKDMADSLRLLEDLLGKDLIGECIVSWPCILSLRFQRYATDTENLGLRYETDGSGTDKEISSSRFQTDGSGTEKETLPENVVFLLNCGFKKQTRILAKALNCTMHKQKQEMEACVRALKSLGLSNNHACRLIKLQPTILTQSSSEITAKLDYILHTFKFSLEELLKYSSFMVYSLDMRIRPRYLMYQWLKSKRLMRRNFKLDYVITMPEKKFLCKYVECHQEGPSKYQEFMKNTK